MSRRGKLERKELLIDIITAVTMIGIIATVFALIWKVFIL